MGPAPLPLTFPAFLLARLSSRAILSRMRLIIFLSLLFGLALPASADQHDPELTQLFAELRAGEGDPLALEDEIQSRWLIAPEESTGLIVERAAKAIELGELAVAEALVVLLTDIAPSFAEGFVLEGRLALARNDENTALRAFTRAVALEPRHYIAHERLGDLALSRGDKARAHEHYRDALQWHPRQRALIEKAERLRAEIFGREI